MNTIIKIITNTIDIKIIKKHKVYNNIVNYFLNKSFDIFVIIDHVFNRINLRHISIYE